MPRAVVNSTKQSSSLHRSDVGIIETWLTTRQASVYKLQAELLEALDTTGGSSTLAVETLRMVAEATSAGWTEAEVRSSATELLARHHRS
ncbi:hypothetical protein [Candidatus Poriferisodalis sp.]|uniref:hypothetical protein n=1 Tax=Candidatus Poriferisodalis sp. TaxID=3101277 RepID=UPI003C6F1FFB